MSDPVRKPTITVAPAANGRVARTHPLAVRRAAQLDALFLVYAETAEATADAAAIATPVVSTRLTDQG